MSLDSTEDPTEPAGQPHSSTPLIVSEARPYLELIASFLESQREILRLAEYVTDRESEIDDPKRMALALAMKSHAGSSHEHFDPLWEKVEAIMKSILSKDEDEADHEGVEDDLANLLKDVPEDHGMTYVLSMMRVFATGPGSPRLLSSLLSALIGDFEVLIAGLARLLITAHPEILARNEKEYNWTEISKFATIDDFRQDVIDRAVDRLLFDSFAEWMEFFGSKCHFSVPAIAATYELLEVFQRRHVVIHNGGRVSRQYIEKLAKHGRTETIGTQLEVDSTYLSRAADALCVLGTCLATNAANKFLKDPDDKKLIEIAMGNYPYELLIDGRFEAVHGIATEQDLGTFANDYTAMVVRVNRWLALKRLGRMSECRDEVEAWQTSTLGDEFKLAQLALLDDLAPAYEIVQRIRGTKALPYEFWIRWPLLDELRQYEFEQKLAEDASAGGN